MNKFILVFITLILGGIIGAYLTLALSTGETSSLTEVEQNKPLYWVAPMDDNYRRDRPGKSPMGMDLVPVYKEADNKKELGAVTIKPHIINNLGVRTEKVKISALPSTITTVGYVQFDEDELVHIHPRVEGWIDTLFVKTEGAVVKAGEPLYTLYSPQLVNAQEELLIALKRKNKTIINAAKARLKALQLSDSFIKKLSDTKIVTQNITFYSSKSGVINQLKVREGFFVKPGNTLMSIGILDHVWVEAEVFERDAALVKTGQKVSMTLDYFPEKTWQGNVDYIYPSLNNKTRTLRVRLKFSNPEQQLKPNMFAQVVFKVQSSEHNIIIPKDAVIRTSTQNRVVIARDGGQFKSVEVVLGRVSQSHVEIINGLTEHDTIVTSAHFLIDSESSKTSDFRRMEERSLETNTVWITGTITEVAADNGIVTIDHEEVQEWQWPTMIMDFKVAQSLDISLFKVDQQLHFEVTKQKDNSYLLTNIHIMEDNSEHHVQSASVNGVIESINKNKKQLTIKRDAIIKWQRPAATVSFLVADHIDINKLKPLDAVSFTFEVRDELVITNIIALAHDNSPQKPHQGH